jgi:hypothetical protein
LSSRRDGCAQRAVRVWADEREPSKHHPHLAGPDVPVDDGRQGPMRPLGAVRALEIGVLDERHRRPRRAEGHALLRDACEGASGGRRRLLRRSALLLARADLAGGNERAAEDECGGQQERWPPPSATEEAQ